MRIGGTLEQSLSQGYRLELQGVLKEAWQQTRRTGFGLALAIAGVMAIWILLSNTLLAPYVSQEGGDMDMALILSLLITVIMSPMTSSLDMLGLQQSVGVRARPNQVFDFFRHFLRLGRRPPDPGPEDSAGGLARPRSGADSRLRAAL